MEESYKYNNVSFIIKRNPRQESKEEWLESVRECCQNIQHPRDGKTVYIGQTFRNVTYSLSDNEEKTVGIRTIYEITERTIDRYGQYFIVPDIELGTYWTNTSLPDETVIDLYHAHGESVQYHSEIKTDMDVERLPSGKFESNKLVLELTMIAYNILRIIGQESLKKKDAPGRKKIHIEFSDERLITPSGLVFVGQILGKSSFVKKINPAQRHPAGKCRHAA